MELYLQITLKCPKCKKEFGMNVKKLIPSGSLRCFACGTVTPFSEEKTRKMQDRVRELEVMIDDMRENFF